MIEIEETILVEGPRDRVFPFAAHPDNMPLWNPAIRETRMEGPLKRGARVVQVVDVVGRRFETTFEVTAYEPSRRVAYSSISGPVRVQGTMEFRQERGRTRIRWVVGGDARRLFRVAEGLLVGMGRPEMRACLENLKRAAESGESADSPPQWRPSSPINPLSLAKAPTRLFGFVGTLVAQR